MKNNFSFVLLFLILTSCGNNIERTHPSKADITETVSAIGILKSKNQYQVFSKMNGTVKDILVREGGVIKKGTPLISISNQTKSNSVNTETVAENSEYEAGKERLNSLREIMEIAKSNFVSDSLLYDRQKKLWDQEIGTRNQFEQRKLAYDNSKSAYEKAKRNYNSAKKQLSGFSDQSKMNPEDGSGYLITSEIDGKVYTLTTKKGAAVNTETPLALVGDTGEFILELQVDENDIVKVIRGQKVLVTLESYKGSTFEAVVRTKNPVLNERSKTFTVEASFVTPPPVLFPNLSIAASIIIQDKKNVITVPVKFISDDGFVIKENGDKIKVQTGIRSETKVEIVSGLSENDEIVVSSK